MATNLAIDEKLLNTAQKISKIKTKRETVNLALKEFIERRKQEEVIEMFDSVDYDKNYDYKKLRSRHESIS